MGPWEVVTPRSKNGPDRLLDGLLRMKAQRCVSDLRIIGQGCEHRRIFGCLAEKQLGCSRSGLKQYTSLRQGSANQRARAPTAVLGLLSRDHDDVHRHVQACQRIA